MIDCSLLYVILFLKDKHKAVKPTATAYCFAATVQPYTGPCNWYGKADDRRACSQPLPSACRPLWFLCSSCNTIQNVTTPTTPRAHIACGPRGKARLGTLRAHREVGTTAILWKHTPASSDASTGRTGRCAVSMVPGAKMTCRCKEATRCQKQRVSPCNPRRGLGRARCGRAMPRQRSSR